MSFNYNSNYGKGPSEYGLLADMSNVINSFLEKLQIYNDKKDYNERSNCDFMVEEEINDAKLIMYNFFRDITLNESIIAHDRAAVSAQNTEDTMPSTYRTDRNNIPCKSLLPLIEKSILEAHEKRKLLISALYEFFTLDLKKKDLRTLLNKNRCSFNIIYIMSIICINR
jgi:hypothetical protein